MSRILIAIDGSKASVKAVSYVVNRKREGETVEAFLVNVQPAVAARGKLMTRSMIEEWQTLESEKACARPDIQTKKRYLGADTYTEIGDAAERLIAFAQKTKCDEIVMGSRGLGGIKGLLLGSVVMKVLQIAPIPVVVVR